MDAQASAWASLMAALPHAAWVFDRASRCIVAANAQAERLLGLGFGGLIGTRGDALIATPEDFAWWHELDSPGAAGEGGESADSSRHWLESHIALPGTSPGTERHVLRSVRLLEDGRHGLVTLVDRTVERHAEMQRETLLAEARATLEASSDGLLVTDVAGCPRNCNARLAQIFGMPETLREGRDATAIAEWMQRGVIDAAAWIRRWQALQRAPLACGTLQMRLASGAVVEWSVQPLWANGVLQGHVSSFADITASVDADQRIAAGTQIDALTGLPNRRRLTQMVGDAILASRAQDIGFALLIIDMDHFNHVNDTLGHDRGDEVLVDVTRRIEASLGEDDQLARVGGDQFALLLRGPQGASPNSAEVAARRVLAQVTQPCEFEGLQFTLTCSIGAALFPGHGAQADTLISHAERAMRQAKDSGRATVRLHQGRARVDLRRHMALDHAMRQALVSGRFRLHYQPQINLADGAMVGAEALIRWRDPQQGEISPGQFIPVAEDTGFIVAIGDWVLSQAVRQAAVWHGRGLAMPVAVNVSALQFQQSHFVERVASVLAVSGLPGSLLELELTESILLRDAEEALHRLQALAKLGVQLAIDDFGTGYSSLAYLKRFPIAKLKVDRSFVKGLPSDDSDAAIVRAVLQMARALGIKVVAEGVETEAQRQFLQDLGCDMFQGFLFAPALDSLSFEHRLLAAHGIAPAPAVALAGSRMRLVHG